MDDTAHQLNQHGRLGIAQRPHDAGRHIEDEHEGQPEEEYLHIVVSILKNAGGSIDRAQKSGGGQQADDGQQNAADQPQRHRRMDGLAELYLILAPKGLRDDDARADADAREQIDDGRSQEHAGSDRRRSLRTQKIADEENVDGRIELLDQAGPKQGQREQQQLPGDGAVGQIKRLSQCFLLLTSLFPPANACERGCAASAAHSPPAVPRKRKARAPA